MDGKFDSSNNSSSITFTADIEVLQNIRTKENIKVFLLFIIQSFHQNQSCHPMGPVLLSDDHNPRVIALRKKARIPSTDNVILIANGPPIIRKKPGNSISSLKLLPVLLNTITSNDVCFTLNLLLTHIDHIYKPFVKLSCDINNMLRRASDSLEKFVDYVSCSGCHKYAYFSLYIRLMNIIHFGKLLSQLNDEFHMNPDIRRLTFDDAKYDKLSEIIQTIEKCDQITKHQPVFANAPELIDKIVVVTALYALNPLINEFCEKITEIKTK